jgi:hypothetical protein
MNILLKLLTIITFFAFAIIKRADFDLEPGNFGWILLFVILAFIYKYLYKGIIKSTLKTGFISSVQTTIVYS